MQQLDATDTAWDCLMRRHGQVDIKRGGLRTRILQQLVAPLVSRLATPTIMTNLIDAAVKAQRNDIIHLDTTPASRKPAADAAPHIGLLLKSNFNSEFESCRIQSLQLPLERMPA